jgi:hypothetical protein
LNAGHAYGTIADTMEIITTGKERKYFNTLERYHISESSRENLHKNDTHIDTHKLIFKTLHEIYTELQYNPLLTPLPSAS